MKLKIEKHSPIYNQSMKCAEFLQKGLAPLNFFKPYENVRDFGRTLVSPITDSIIWSVGAVLYASAAVACFVASIINCAVGLCSLPFNKNFGHSTLSTSSMLLRDSLIFAVSSFLTVLGAVLCFLESIVCNVTRAGCTVAHVIKDSKVASGADTGLAVKKANSPDEVESGAVLSPA